MKTDELKFKKFEEECRRYLYEKEALLQLEKRFVKVNTSNTKAIKTAIIAEQIYLL